MTSQLEANLCIPFPSPREAEIAFRSLSVDAEPSRSGITRKMSYHDTKLTVHWTADEARKLRVCINGFLEHVILVLQTMHEFGPPVS